MFPLATQRLELRPFEAAFLERFVAYRRKPEVALYQSWSDYTQADALAFYEQQRALSFDTDETWYQLAMVRKQDGLLIGDVAAHFFDEGRQVELGFTLDSAYQKQGYATEAMRAVLKLLFLELKKHRVSATCDAQNVGAQRLLERLGFRQEGVFRKNIFFKGSWGDETTYAMLGEEWARQDGVT